MAGRNYKLTIEIADQDKCVGVFDVVIYDHFGELSVTNWGREHECGDLNELKVSMNHPVNEHVDMEEGH